jgi:hypothetical protein
MDNLVFRRIGLACGIVSLLSTAAVYGDQPVVVTNGANQPVPVAGIVYLQNPVLATPQPVQFEFNLDFGITAVAPKITFPIAAGKRFTIEHFAARCNSLNPASQTFFLRLGAQQNTPLAWLDTSAISYAQGNFYPGSVGANAKPLHTYVDGGSIWADGERSTTGGATNCTLTVLGFYTNMPQQYSGN